VYLRAQWNRADYFSNNGRKTVEPVVINNNSTTVGRIKEQFGNVHAITQNRRQQAHKIHTGDYWQPQGTEISPLIEPLSRRQQAHMSYRFSDQLKTQLSSGKLPSGNAGRKRKSFREIDPILISSAMPFINELTGRRLNTAPTRLARLL
jgi:hypothetical protein